MIPLGDALARIDERVISIQTSVAELKDKVELLEKELRSSNKDSLLELKNATQGFVGHEEFKPVKNLVYGFVGIALTAVVISIITLAVRSYPA